MKCLNCSNCLLEKSKRDSHQVYARCTKLPTPRTSGKIITWAMDLVGGPKAEVRVKQSLEKYKTPNWCPLEDTPLQSSSINIADYIEKFKIVQASLAASLGVSDSYISKLKTGEMELSNEFREKFLNLIGLNLIPVETPLSVAQAKVKDLTNRVQELEELVVSLNTQVKEYKDLVIGIIKTCQAQVDITETYDLKYFGIIEEVK